MAKGRSQQPRETSPLMRLAARFGVPAGAGLAFGGQFLISLRGASALATIAPGVALYAAALVLVVMALRAGKAVRAENAADPERFIAGRVEWILLAVIL